MNNAVFGKSMKKLRENRDIKRVKTKARRNYLVSDPNYHTTNIFSRNLLAKEIKKKIFMNKLVYLCLSILEISKIVMYEI